MNKSDIIVKYTKEVAKKIGAKEHEIKTNTNTNGTIFFYHKEQPVAELSNGTFRVLI